MIAKVNASLCYKWVSIRKIFWFMREFMNISISIRHSNFSDIPSKESSIYSYGEKGLILRNANGWGLLIRYAKYSKTWEDIFCGCVITKHSIK